MIRQPVRADQTADDGACTGVADRAIIGADRMSTFFARTLAARCPNPRLAVLLLTACGVTNPLGQATTEPGTSEGTETSEATTEEPPTTGTSGTTEEPDTCDGDGVCDAGEDAQNCPSDCEPPPGCGDGAIGGSEACDDGADNGMYGFCNASCSGQVGCGDGMVNGDEACDDAEDNSDEYSPDPHCNANCTALAPYCGDGLCQQGDEDSTSCAEDCMPGCGNGVVDPGEDCDDGVESADCNADCTNAACGDGKINGAAGEACDDGNMSNGDACPACEDAVCGDGFVQVGVEPCDDGDDINENECSTACELPRLVFASSLTKNGNLAGIAGADVFCQTLAASAGLSGNHRAWLSDAAEGPAARFDTSFTGAYKRVDGVVVAANGWSDLVDGSIDNPINVTEKNLPAVGVAWTNTKGDGTSASANDCSGWTNTSGTSVVGELVSTDEKWTNLGGGQFCSAPFYLYCLEDLP